MNAVEVSGLRKSYDGNEAVRGISFEIAAGEVFGLLGPNGAGKTTTVEILEGYRLRDAGTVTVLGTDPADAPDEWRGRLGIVPQSGDLFPNLSVIETLRVVRPLLPAPARSRGRRPPRRPSGASATPATARSRAGSGGAWTSAWRSSATRSWCSWTSPPPASTPPRAARPGSDPVAARPRQDDPADDALHRGGAAARRPRRGAREGRDRRLGTPADLISAGSLHRDPYRRAGEVVVVETEDPTRVLHELTGEALAAGTPLEELEVRRPTLEEIYLTLTEEE